MTDDLPNKKAMGSELMQGTRSARRGINFLVFVGGVLLFCFLVSLAYLGRSLVMPLIIAVVLWYLINLMASGLQRVPLAVGGMPRPIALTLSFATVLFGLWAIYAIVTSNAAAAMAMFMPQAGPDGIAASQPNLAALLPDDVLNFARGIVDALPSWMGISMPSNEEIASSINAVFTDLQRSIGALWSPTRQAITQLTATASTLAIVLLYMIFIFMEQGTFEKKVRALTTTEANYANWGLAVGEVAKKLNAYVVIKALMSLLTAVISLAVYWAFGVQFALFWALLVFVLNFIPVIGSIIAWFLPMIVVVFGDYSLVQVLSIGFLLLGVQQLVGSIIEPRIAGDVLNLSPLVILLSLAFWGALWGVLGLFLAVPLTVVLTSILSRFRGTRWVAILLSRDGQISN